MAETVGDLLIKVGADISGVESAATQVESSLGKVAASGQQLESSLRPVNRAAESLTKNLVSLATGGGLTAERLVSTGKALRDLAGAGSAIAQANPGGAIDSIGSSLVRLSPLAAAAGLAFVVFRDQMALATESLEREKKKIDDFNKTAADGFAKLREQSDNLKFEASISGLSEFEQGVARAARETQKIGEAAKLAQGAINAINAGNLETQIDAAMKKISVDSQEAGQKLSTEIRKGVDDAVTEIDKLKAAINVKPAEETLAALRSLGASLDFSGPVSELQKLQASLDEAAKKITDVGKKVGLEPAFIAGQIAEGQTKIKAAFKEDIKLKAKLDVAEAERTFKDQIAKLNASPPVVIKTEVNVNLAQLLAEKSRIQSAIADDPYNIDLRADLKQVDAQIAAKRAEEQGKKLTIPVDANTTAFTAAIAEAARKAQDNLAAALDAVSGKSKSLGFFDPGELNSALDQARSAISSGDTDAIRDVLAGLRNFLATNSGPFGAGQQNLQLVNSAIQSLVRALQVSGQNPLQTATALGSGGSFASALSQLDRQLAGQVSEQEQTNALLRESNDISRANLDATRDVGSGLTTGNILTAIIEKTRAATGRRGATI